MRNDGRKKPRMQRQRARRHRRRRLRPLLDLLLPMLRLQNHPLQPLHQSQRLRLRSQLLPLLLHRLRLHQRLPLGLRS